MKYYFLTLLFIIDLGSVNAAQSAELGRFFTTPEERSNLDILRKNSKEEVLKEVESPTPALSKSPVTATLPDNVSMQGYVTRSDGKKGTVWVNHQAMQEGSANDEVSIGKFGTKNNQVPIEIHANKKTVRLKAGQSYQPSDDTLLELGNSPKPSKAPDAATLTTPEKPAQ